jgi:excisionase family DNA binding protein
MKPREVCAELRVEYQTIVRWCREGKFPGAFKPSPNRWLIPREAVERIIHGGADDHGAA